MRFLRLFTRRNFGDVSSAEANVQFLSFGFALKFLGLIPRLGSDNFILKTVIVFLQILSVFQLAEKLALSRNVVRDLSERD